MLLQNLIKRIYVWQLTQCCKIKKHLLRFAFAFSVVATITSFTSCTDDDTEEIDEVNNRHILIIRLGFKENGC